MKLGTSFAKLEEMKKLASGDLWKIAEYKQAQREYDDMVAEYFNVEDGVKYISHPHEWYVLELEERAKTGTDRDIARAVILRDRYNTHEADKLAYFDQRATQQELTARVSSGAKLTQKDVDAAHKHAKLNPSEENRVLYARIKREFENPTERTVPLASEPVTQEMVDAAADKARRSGSTHDNAAYAVIKRQFESQ